MLAAHVVRNPARSCSESGGGIKDFHVLVIYVLVLYLLY